MHKPVIIPIFTLLLCAVLPAQAAEPASAASLQQIEALQRRVERLAFGELGPNNYHLSKARAWLSLATSEYHEKDTSGTLEAAIGQATTLLEAIEAKQADIAMDTPVQIPGSEAVRPDLQDRIATLKKHENFRCGQRPVAEAEVYLVWAGHEFYEQGQSHAESYLRSVENLAYEAQVAMDNCAPIPEPAPAPAPVVVQAPPLEKITLSGDALFAFTKAELNPEALGQLDNIAENIKQVEQLEEVLLIGHTDRYGNPQKNQLLSEKRAESIKKYLIGKGVPADKIHTKGAGSTLPVVQCPPNQNKAKQIVCLQKNRRVEVILRGTKAGSNAQPAAASGVAGQPASK